MPHLTKICACCKAEKPRADFLFQPYITRWGKPHTRCIQPCLICRNAGRRERTNPRTKQCIKCHRWRDAVQFYRHEYITKTGNKSSRFESRCKSCKSAAKRKLIKRRRYSRAFGKANYQKHRKEFGDANYRCKVRREYNLTPAQRQALWDEQGGLCKICREPEKGRRFHVDHDHATLKVRGLLCHKCNVGLGMAGDNTERLVAMQRYLEAHV